MIQCRRPALTMLLSKLSFTEGSLVTWRAHIVAPAKGGLLLTEEFPDRREQFDAITDNFDNYQKGDGNKYSGDSP